ncbi:GNAT family N-acetyltransferase [Vagococcus salmoninarum]|uniref:N-acetyltransferase domain-containing protein n=1 Tax=Vagococcus salmoninarum TaxID=2739 RepID=A0A429ZS82_9ENTE|nr:GNAT family N-acetyltransferase [Vagococcus salmoninarum]RST96498.1 hypothetical protein CBF35_06195 [Vagococcus salmoninarum]
MKITCSKLTDLAPIEVTKIYQARIQVFVVEQNCPYPEIDQWDYQGLHLCFWAESGEVLAYSRIIQKESYITFGRVLVANAGRGRGLGRKLVLKVLEKIQEINSEQLVKISAQTYLKDFYQSFGFHIISESYLEDGISHVDMVRNHPESDC